MNRLAPCLTKHLSGLGDHRADGELLAAFLHHQDEPAFAELLRRHGSLVWAACRRLLPDPADAEDAFQAAFLVLVRRAARLTGQNAIGPWLYRVAAFTARNIRRRNARTLARRVPLSPAVADPTADPGVAELRADLDAALLALPEKYRTALVLCHLQGFSRRDAAARLGCPEGTLSSLLARGLARLRDKLAGRDPTAALIVGSTVPAVLVSATARAASACRLSAAGAASLSVTQLAEGVLRMFWVKKATAATAALFAVFALGVGVGVGVRFGPATAQEGPGEKPAKASPPANADDREIEELKQHISGYRTTIVLFSEQVKSREANIERLQKDKATDPVALASEREGLVSFRNIVADAEKRLRESTAILEVLEAKRAARAEPLQPKPPGLAKPNAPETEAFIHAYRRLKESEAVLSALAARIDDLEQYRKKAQQVDRDIEDARKQLAAATADLAKWRATLKDLEARGFGFEKAPAAAPLVVTVSSAKEAWPCTIKEFDTKTGKLIGTLNCDTVEILGVSLARTMKDPNGPRELRINVEKDAPVERLKAVLEACKAAGFKEAKVSGVIVGFRTPFGTSADGDRVQDLYIVYHMNGGVLPLDFLIYGVTPGKPEPAKPIKP